MYGDDDAANQNIVYASAQHSTRNRYNNREESAVQYSIVQYSTVQYSIVQYSTVQYSTVQYSTVLTECYVVYEGRRRVKK